MEIIEFLLLFLIIGILGFLLMKKTGMFLEEVEENRNLLKSVPQPGEQSIAIACENPVMLSAINCALEKSSNELHGISYRFYTGDRKEIQKMLEEHRVDVILLLEKADLKEKGNYGEKTGSFAPFTLSESLTGIIIEPVRKEQTTMYVFWDEGRITENQRKLLSYI